MELVDKILKLNELGYSKDEIDSLLKKEEVIEIDLVGKDEKPSEDKTVEEKPVEPEVPQEKDETIERLSSIEETLKAIQANNVKWSNMPTVEEKTELELVQEILGGIKPNGN